MLAQRSGGAGRTVGSAVLSVGDAAVLTIDGTGPKLSSVASREAEAEADGMRDAGAATGGVAIVSAAEWAPIGESEVRGALVAVAGTLPGVAAVAARVSARVSAGGASAGGAAIGAPAASSTPTGGADATGAGSDGGTRCWPI